MAELAERAGETIAKSPSTELGDQRFERLSRTDAGVMASTTLAVPAIVVVMSWLLLAEVPTAVRIAGGALALIGVAISRGLVGRRPKRIRTVCRTPSPEYTGCPTR